MFCTSGRFFTTESPEKPKSHIEIDNTNSIFLSGRKLEIINLKTMKIFQFHCIEEHKTIWANDNNSLMNLKTSS